jgi:adenylate cyclase
MQCRRCGCQNEATHEFCELCGAILGAGCSNCGHLNSPEDRFCGGCGLALSTPGTDRANQSWHHVLNSLTEKGGERKHVTILFADISNSTGLIDSLGDPELGMRRLQPALNLMNEAVVRYDGVVNKSQGDGVMALFGALKPHEDHAARGCLAALAMQDGITQFNDFDLQIRVGVHTGEVVVLTIDHEIYQTFDAAGANVHIANRLEQMADAGGILVSKDTYDAAKQFVEAESLGPQRIRGIGSPIELSKITGVRHAPSSGVFRSGRRLSPFIGRDDQLSSLFLELENTISGDGRVVGVVGEAGIGKSRLCFEFAESCRRRDIRVFEARVLAHGKATLLQPVLELLRDYFGLRVTEPAEISRRRLLDRSEALAISEQTTNVLLEFLGVADPLRQPVKLDPKARKELLLDFVRTLARSGPRGAATVVIIEDLHWIDAASEEFIEALADAVVGTSTLLVVDFRPGITTPIMRRSHYRQIAISPLKQAQSAILLEDQLGGDPSLALLGKTIIERAQGNPFFLEELISTLVERGDLGGERGAYQLKAGIDSIPLPSTVQAVIAARIDRLDPRAKEVLEIASVVGREISQAILDTVSGFSQVELMGAVRNLRRAQLLYDVPPFEQRLLAFRHPLIQEVAYRSLLLEHRKKLHFKVAQAIETHFKHQADERASLLAYHFEQAGENLKAAQQDMRAAIWVGANDPGQALRSWMRVRKLLSDLPPSQPINYLRAMASGQIVNFGWREGMSAEDAAVYFDEAKGLTLELGEIRANALVHAGYGRILANGGSADAYVEKIREAMEIPKKASDLSVQITLKAVLCHALRLAGRMPEALQMNVEATARASEIEEFDRQMLGFDVELWLTAMRGHILVVMGRYNEARPFLDQILQLDGDKVDLVYILPSLAYVDLAWAEGNAALAQEHADRASSIAAKGGNPYQLVSAKACQGLSHIVAGRLTSAIEDLSDALRFARSRKAGLENEPRILADLANAYRLNGDGPAAFWTVAKAIDVATERRARVPECLARIIHARLLSAGTDDDRVAGQRELERAQALMRDTGATMLGAVS